jgi:hypothetical protein
MGCPECGQPVRVGTDLLSDTVSAALYTDDWVIIANGFRILNADDLDAAVVARRQAESNDRLGT